MNAQNKATEKIALVTGADKNYFPILRELIHSVRRHTEANNIAICVIDGGLTEDQKSVLEPLCAAITEPDWPCALPDTKTKGQRHIKSCACRPFINQIFAGYDIYLWIDADIWVQDWRGVELFLEGARRKKLAIAAQVDRAYPKAARVKWLGRWPWKVRNFYFGNACDAFSFTIAKQLVSKHVLSAGIFALHKDAQHWKRWQELAIRAMTHGKLFTAEQLTLGILTHIEDYPAEILPAWAHWLCEFKPLWDEKSQRFIEPYLPHEPISCLHLTGFDTMRLDRSKTLEFQTLQGNMVEKSYRYPFFNGETGEESSLSDAA